MNIEEDVHEELSREAGSQGSDEEEGEEGSDEEEGEEERGDPDSHSDLASDAESEEESEKPESERGQTPGRRPRSGDQDARKAARTELPYTFAGSGVLVLLGPWTTSGPAKHVRLECAGVCPDCTVQFPWATCR